jgi:hypothetical protein
MPTETKEFYSATGTIFGHIEVRIDTVIRREDGQEVARLPHRHVIEPGQDLAGEHPRAIAIALATWEPENIIRALRPAPASV